MPSEEVEDVEGLLLPLPLLPLLSPPLTELDAELDPLPPSVLPVLMLLLSDEESEGPEKACTCMHHQQLQMQNCTAQAG